MLRSRCAYSSIIRIARPAFALSARGSLLGITLPTNIWACHQPTFNLAVGRLRVCMCPHTSPFLGMRTALSDILKVASSISHTRMRACRTGLAVDIVTIAACVTFVRSQVEIGGGVRKIREPVPSVCPDGTPWQLSAKWVLSAKTRCRRN